MKQNKKDSLQELILERLDLSREMTREQVQEMIDEQISQESRKRHLEVSEREHLRTKWQIKETGYLF